MDPTICRPVVDRRVYSDDDDYKLFNDVRVVRLPDEMGGGYSTGGVFVVKEKDKKKGKDKGQRRRKDNAIGERDRYDDGRFE